MKIHRIGIVVFLCIIAVLSACSNISNDSVEASKPQVEQSNESIELRKETEHFEFYCIKSDAECLEDLAGALEGNYSRITTDLNADLDFKVKVHVYKGIDAFHKAIGRTDAPSWVAGVYYENGIKMDRH